jgi:trehalose synthase
MPACAGVRRGHILDCRLFLGKDVPMREVELTRRPLAALASVLTVDQRAALVAAAARARKTLAGRVIWNINATAKGGGVAEILQTLLGYLLDAGVDARWLVLEGNADFFLVTKHLHNTIHGFGDPGQLGASAHAVYQRTLQGNAAELLRQVRPSDLVMLHDPQSAGLIEPLRQAGVRVAWRSHIGRDTPNEQSDSGWEFLRRYVQDADALVFSRPQYAPEWAPASRIWIIPPSIDPLDAKNRPMAANERIRVLAEAGLLMVNGGPISPVIQGAPPPTPAARLIVQVSRWDRLKDMPGVMTGFADAGIPGDVHLMLVGPTVSGVTDDPEGAEVLNECVAYWHGLPASARNRISLVSVPMDDLVKNATIINAVQGYADVVTQKSLAEGFGLTVTEAMWKGRPILGSAVGGIQDQITDGQDGLLIKDPTDLDAFAKALRRLFREPGLAHELGHSAHRRVLTNYLDDRHLASTVDLLAHLRGAS